MHQSPSKPSLKRKRVQKHVRFSTVTELTFRVGVGACVVPSDSMPGVGLAGSPIEQSVKSVRPDGPGCVMTYTSQDRLYLLQRSGLNPTDLANECLELKRIQISRQSHAREHIELKRQQEQLAKATRSQMDLNRLLW
ncbi:unnamed protein product [Aphanomyces euteiches]|uniref:Uncharacterized protein n=1 Tax=Aphanomyces euteiches TaxID=100861 RepID=A0A6G0WZF5_9STRA|nr:hypothetical protein Ae201684_010229 [Aphanomyces euteiches]KAH9075915.1 hypothetical protein Ae201684P_012407 [Aphanomyces euteiches]KAH9151659.1 hypothetical protein AeRB84_005770 [Aphanomyces euteiches]